MTHNALRTAIAATTPLVARPPHAASMATARLTFLAMVNLSPHISESYHAPQ